MIRRGTSDSEAELLCMRWLEFEGWTVHRAQKAARYFPRRPRAGDPPGVPRMEVRTVSHDLFGALDLLAIHPANGTWGLQLTTQSGRSARRRKVELVAWPHEWRISLVTHEAVESPIHRGRRDHYWRVEDYSHVSPTPRPGADRPSGRERDWDLPTAVRFNPREVEAHARSRRDEAAQ